MWWAAWKRAEPPARLDPVIFRQWVLLLLVLLPPPLPLEVGKVREEYRGFDAAMAMDASAILTLPLTVSL